VVRKKVVGKKIVGGKIGSEKETSGEENSVPPFSLIRHPHRYSIFLSSCFTERLLIVTTVI
jgi:hypothetical protein